MATKQEEDFLNMVGEWEQQDLVAMLKEWVFFGELPATSISEVLKRSHPDYAIPPVE